jgi:hypothetical protein
LKFLKFLFLSVFIVLWMQPENSNAASPKVQAQKFQNFLNTKSWLFKENKGQLADNQGNILNDVKYYGNQGGVNILCKPGMISFVFIRMENEGSSISEATAKIIDDPQNSTFKIQHSKLITCRADLLLLNSNPSATIIPSEKQEYYENYYLAHTPENGITHVNTFKTITYKNIYPNIDLVLHTKECGLKYEFIVFPGGEISDIRMQWNGLNTIKNLENGGISYAFGFGKMVESKPFVYQGDNTVKCSFDKNSNRIGFDIKKYDKSKILIIDPTLDWGTFIGGNSWTDGYGIALDEQGNVYLTGLTESTSGIATAGSYQSVNNNYIGFDNNAFLAKFSSNGSLYWCTYFGGDSSTQAYGISIYKNNIYFAGSTNSTIGIATIGAYQERYNSVKDNHYNSDGFLAKFNPNGSRIWSTYFGGPGFDWIASIVSDQTGNIYIGGGTSSTTGISSKGAYQVSFGGGNGDAFLSKFDSAGSLKWTTYFGGENRDGASGLAIDSFNNIYISGASSSSSGIATTGAFQTKLGNAPNDNNDAFLAKFNSNGSLLWATYFGGEKNDGAVALAIDYSGNVFITGVTSSDTGIATSGAYQTSLIGNGNRFLAKFNAAGAELWATYYGGTAAANGCITIDQSNNIFTGGITTGKSNFATKEGWQSYYGGSDDGFFAEFSEAGMLKYATYFGGKYQDWLNAMASDKQGNIYITGVAGSPDSIATPGAYRSTRDFNSSDAYLVKFNFNPVDNDAGIAGIIKPEDSICPVNNSVKFILKNFGKNILDSVIVQWTLNGTKETSYHWFGKLAPDSTAEINLGAGYFSAGINTIKAWTTQPNGLKDSVPGNDTSFRTYLIHKPDQHWILQSLSGRTKKFSAIDTIYPSSAYEWNFGDGITATGKQAVHGFKQDGDYQVVLSICNESFDSLIWAIDHVEINIYPNPVSDQTKIWFKLSDPSKVKISITDVLGREICILADNYFSSGEHILPFKPSIIKTRAGIYFIQIRVDETLYTRKIIQLESKFY